MNRFSPLIAALMLIVASCATVGDKSARPTAACEPRLRQMVAAADYRAISLFKENWESGWGQGWALDSASEAGIDEFMLGIVLKWSRVDERLRVERLDAFTLDGCIYSAHETHYRDGNEFARGGVYITQAGEPTYRALVYVTGPMPPPSSDLSKLFDMSDVLYYELEVFSGGTVVSVYRSHINIGVDSVTMEPVNVTEDARLIRGVPWPAVERARKTKTHGARIARRHNNPLHLTAGVGCGVEVTSVGSPAAGERER